MTYRKGKITMCKCNCTYLVASVTLDTTAGNYVVTFDRTPTVTDNGCFKFRVPCNISTVATPNTPMVASVILNGVVTNVPLWECNGNVLRTGQYLKTRTVYCAQFGSDPNHLLVKRVSNV
jgi:hypothetical protein